MGQYISTDNRSSIRCLSLLETAADKASALVWRVLSRHKGGEVDDPSVIRHLYDLCALYAQVPDLSLVLDESRARYQVDRMRGQDDLPGSFEEAFAAALDTLRSDVIYRKEYDRFVLNMCFGLDKPPDFSGALERFSALI